MKVIVQRVSEASVEIDKKINGKINTGYLILTGFTKDDNKETIDKMVNKIVNLRIFEDDNEKMNLSLEDVNGSILSISQFTLYAKLNGRRPSFSNALNYDDANDLYNYFNNKIKEKGINIQTGIFGADMIVSLVNDGPVTIVIDSKEDL